MFVIVDIMVYGFELNQLLQIVFFLFGMAHKVVEIKMACMQMLTICCICAAQLHHIWTEITKVLKCSIRLPHRNDENVCTSNYNSSMPDKKCQLEAA